MGVAQYVNYTPPTALDGAFNTYDKKSNWGNSWHLVVSIPCLKFKNEPRIALYDRAHGRLKVIAVNAEGDHTVVSDGSFARNWDLMVGAMLSGTYGAIVVLFCYSRDGYVAVFNMSTGEPKIMGLPQGGWRSTWDVASVNGGSYPFSAAMSDQLVMYDRSRGDLKIFEVDDKTGFVHDGFTHKVTHRATQMVTGRFGGDHGDDGVLLYRRDSGLAEFFATTYLGAIEPIGTGNLGAGIDVVVPGWFQLLPEQAESLVRPTQLFCYSRQSGQAKLVNVVEGAEETFKLSTRWSEPNWGKGWKSITPAWFQPPPDIYYSSQAHQLLHYHPK